jgi:hypothetical protein
MAVKKKPLKKKRKPKKPAFIRMPEPPMAIIHVEYADQHALAHNLYDAHQAAVSLIAENDGLDLLDNLSASFFLEAVKREDYIGAIQIWTLRWNKCAEKASNSKDEDLPRELTIESMQTTGRRPKDELVELVKRIWQLKAAPEIAPIPTSVNKPLH